MEALQIKFVKKNEKAPGTTEQIYIQPLLQSQTHVQDVGWQNYMYAGGKSGTTRLGKQIEAFKIKLMNKRYSGSIAYQAHIADIGWQN